ncbi:PAS domain-containing protein [Aestuariimicrobium soli]|uniref:PAS domain-containing protein n=1 Tax=Aestuariimicrobium soli TaxID=2035834 RepID=UPI003EBBDA53
MTDPVADLEARIIDQAGDAVIAIDRSGDITHWNQHASRLFGWTIDEVRGSSIELMIPEKLRGPHWHGFDAAMAAGHLSSDGAARRTKALTKGGDPVYVEMTFAVLTDEAGQAVGAIAVARQAPPRS